jgi:hypothetical protein
MKNLILACLFIGFLVACQPKETTPDTLPMKVAMAYGFDKFDEVKSIAYTWNVQVDSARVLSRDWKWNINDRTVYYSGPDTSYTYSLDMPSDSLPTADKGFINDKYWMMMPFQLAWDSGYTYESEENVASPIAGKNSTKLTIVYSGEDGYTPGDAYDLYLDENNMILEWVFRRGNGPDGRPTTWENVQQFGPIKLATDHANAAGQKFIWFTNISVN